MTNENQIKHRARAILKYALERKKVIRPSACEECGNIPRPFSDGKSPIQGHHHMGYDNPLDVVWLCVGCHAKHTSFYSGSSSPYAKLTDAQVLEVRTSSESSSKIAPRYNMSAGQIRKIRRGGCYSNVPAAPGDGG